MVKTTSFTGTTDRPKKKPPVLLITGLSGAGRSSVLNALEDLGYTVVDNLPLDLLPAFLENKQEDAALAITFSAGSLKETAPALQDMTACLCEKGREKKLVFLESDDTAIERRYRETRRSHPFLVKGGTLEQAIRTEKSVLKSWRDAADHILDTSILMPIELRALMRKLFNFQAQKPFWVDVVSFAFGRGVPAEANFVFDMRFLKNPHYQDTLRHMTGRDLEVQEYLKTVPMFADFLDKLQNMLSIVIPPAFQEGRGLFVLAFGCSGGRHRSVAAAQLCFSWLQENGYESAIRHRELDFE